jgi:hypothetical protein
VSHPFLIEYNATTKYGNWTSGNNKKFGTVPLPDDIVGTQYLRGGITPIRNRNDLGDESLDRHLFCHYASNNLDKCALVLRFCYENVLNGLKFRYVMKFSCFFGEKSF